MEQGNFLIVSDEGIVASKGMYAKDVVVMLMGAVIEVWNRDFCKIDKDKAPQAIIDAFESCRVRNEDKVIKFIRKLIDSRGGTDGEA